tara:strand:+ start:4930 stop:5061 length:132 start_codon:yes stop_codon:yes gene_type:complete
MFDSEGNYIGNPHRSFIGSGELINIDDYAAASNGRLVLPDAGE